MENQKVMEAAYNFTDAVIENKSYFIERGFYSDTLVVKIKFQGVETPIAYYDVIFDTLKEALPIRDIHQKIKEACLQYDRELKESEQRERKLKEEFEAWRAKNGK